MAAFAAAGLVLAACADPASNTSMGGGQAPPSSDNLAAIKAANDAAVLSPLAFAFTAKPWPVTGTDGQRHYAYELTVMNQANGTATLTSVQTLDGATKHPIGQAMTGATLSQMIRLNGTDARSPVLAPGASARLFLDAVQPVTSPVAKTLTHRIKMSWQQSGQPKQAIAFTGVESSVVQRAPVVVSPPLRGARWVIGNGCCSPINAHRRTTLAINGTIDVAQRFAVDLVQLTPSGAAVSGDPSKLSSYPQFGQQIHAAAGGTVVLTHDGEPEEPPGSLPPGGTIHTADGNYVVIGIGHGLYTFYAHMQPGSLNVKPGDHVRTGDVLGLLGNTGNTDGPHLHFHVMDSPSPLTSNGVPFVFTSFTGSGGVTDDAALENPKPGVIVPVDSNIHAGAHTKLMPLNDDLVNFGD